MAFSRSASAAALLGAIILGQSVGAVTARRGGHHIHRRLRHVGPTDDISEYLEEQHSLGISNPAFTILGILSTTHGGRHGRFLNETRDGDGDGDGTTMLFELDVVEASPSVTADTLLFVDGTASTAGDYPSVGSTRLLVSARSESASGDFALLAVDSSASGGGTVDGLVRRAGIGLLKVTSVPGAATTVSEQAEFVPPAWECGSSDERAAAPRFDASELVVDGTTPVGAAGAGGGGAGGGSRRRRAEERRGHGHGHHDDHEHHRHRRRGREDDLLSQLRSDLHDSRVEALGRRRVERRPSDRRELYPTDRFPQLYSYEVDLYIEVDKVLFANQGSDGGRTIAYVNALVTAASAIFEREIDTRRECSVTPSARFCHR